MTWYEVLGVRHDASGTDIRRAFTGLARRYHPDLHAGSDEPTRRSAEQRMRELNDAWAVLGDPERRRAYDRSLTGGSGGTGSAGGPARPRPTGATGPRATGAAASGRDWRSYASPGPGGARRRPIGEQLLTLSPMLLLLWAGLFGMAGALVGYGPFYGMALVSLIGSATAFFMMPIWVMARSARSGRSTRPSRSPSNRRRRPPPRRPGGTGAPRAGGRRPPPRR